MLIVVETPLPEDALSLARALRRAAQNATHRRERPQATHMNRERGKVECGASAQCCVIDEHAASCARSLLHAQTRAFLERCL